MSELPYQEDTEKWAEKKRISRKCEIHHCYFDISLGCALCRAEHADVESKEAYEWSLFAMLKSGYKFVAGSYWKKIRKAELSLYDGMITRSDSEGLWVKVTRREATDDIRIKPEDRSV